MGLELTAHQAAHKGGADPARLLDSRSVADQFEALDPSDAKFAERLDSVVAAEVEANPLLRAGGSTPTGSPKGGADFAPGAPATVTPEQFARLSYAERVNLQGFDPDLYRQLSAASELRGRRMATGRTTAAQMIVPGVWAGMVQSKFKGAVVLGTMALNDTTLEGEPGDSVNFPKWKALGEAEDLAEGTAVPPEQLGTDPGDSTTIEEAGEAVEITERARLVAFGDPYTERQRQLGVIAREDRQRPNSRGRGLRRHRRQRL
ncbi:hypothetical protein [Streptomyces sp. 35G-GA-8]|uniref:hypothetical protein n=1 Tax=Streptomyces sp. 35G-GA-8 TaxID=2939434 RepID=UPI00201F0F32|nr:hypothetical protein [Streptomyces sp. 35G-GA-8]MCL7380891.1 hypothetical protein [Streptomyces sp. 35G-GA-8]